MAGDLEGRSEKDRALIQRQLLWTLAAMGGLGLLALGWSLGQDRGWGNPERAVAAKLAQGEKAQVSGRLAEAAEAYRKVAERYPQHPQAPQAMVQLASLRQQLGRHREALEVLVKLEARLSADPSKKDMWAYTLLQLGEARRQLGDYAGAEQAYAQVRSRFPGSDWAGEAQQGRGKVLQAQGLYAKARAAYQVLAREMPGGFLAAEAETSIGECYQLEKNPRAALRTYESIMRRYPDPVWEGVKDRADALRKELENAPAKESTRG